MSEQRILIRPVQESDLVWIMPLGQELEEQGHIRSVADGKEFLGVEQVAQQIAQGFPAVGCLVPDREEPAFHEVTFSCLVLDEEPIGFVVDRSAFGAFRDGEVYAPFDIPLAFSEEDGDGAIEIWLLAIRAERRGDGFGRLLLDWYLSQCGPGMMVLCRCPPAPWSDDEPVEPPTPTELTFLQKENHALGLFAVLSAKGFDNPLDADGVLDEGRGNIAGRAERFGFDGVGNLALGSRAGHGHYYQ